MEETKTVAENYLAALKKRVEAAQESGDIPNDFVYSFGGKTVVMTLPQSVMAQKRLLNLRNKHLDNPSDFGAEEDLLRAIAPNVRINGVVVNLEQLDFGELEVMKTAYMDSLLLPLFLGGDRALTNYMKVASANIK